MRMELNQSIEIKYDSELREPLDLFRRPRLGLFSLGVSSTLVALILIWFELYPSSSSVRHERDDWFLCAVFGLAGISACLYSMVSEFRHIHRFRISQTALNVTWSRVPALFAVRDIQVDRFGWSDFDAIAWFEAESFVVLNQKLLFQFRCPNVLDMQYIEIHLGEERNTQLGNLLANLLPQTTAFPQWVLKLKNQN